MAIMRLDSADSSKDLEKDERRRTAMERAWVSTEDTEPYRAWWEPYRAWWDRGWLQCEDHFEARLQQVKAERDEAKIWSESAENPAFDAGWKAGLGRGTLINRAERINAERRAKFAEAELSIAREALEAARDDLYKAANQFKGMYPEGKNAEIFESKAERIEAVLVRLQAKEEGT